MKQVDGYYLGRHSGFTEPGTPQARLLDIQNRAHEIWTDAGEPEGDDWNHWLQAEKEFDEMVGGW